ncbi:CGNR zinc finger domain-containing protein [Aliirhizobium terrae]|uniref:CGNR zinc finger domain-containing protein n=1 Tax=Terrirhizobium terrae TaxID=2926709 RepID=UPI002576DD4E|nr:CGNR zinc finger domain-containing protein [Rhizobium sp. CC-CFT758]WJH39563.1 CGNR zinc finger domain-containing protein [Rhizobium sp. CC-CFT758]
MSFTWTQHRFAGGALALDVANSVILRFDPVRSVDRFADPEHLRSFPAAAATFSAERALFGELLPVEPLDRPRFFALREAIDRYFRARVLGKAPDGSLADLLEAIAALLRRSSAASLEVATAHSALRLLDAGAVERLKICGHCGWLFLDRSKNRSRAWCDMAVCGNREKARRFHDRQKERARR